MCFATSLAQVPGDKLLQCNYHQARKTVAPWYFPVKLRINKPNIEIENKERDPAKGTFPTCSKGRLKMKSFITREKKKMKEPAKIKTTTEKTLVSLLLEM